MKSPGQDNNYQNGRNGKPKYLPRAGTPKPDRVSAAEKPPFKSRKNGGGADQRVPDEGRALRQETELEKITREGKDLSKNFLTNYLKQLKISEVRREALEKRIAFKAEVEEVLFTREFFESLDPREKIQFWRMMDVSIQTEAGLTQRLQALGDAFGSYHNLGKLVDQLIFLERKKEIDADPPPYSPEFKPKVREEYLKRVLGITHEPENPEF